VALDSLDTPVQAFLAHQRRAHLATADGTGEPHVVPICFAIIGGTLYSVIDHKPKLGTPQNLRRVRNLLENPRAAVVVDVYDEDWSRLGYVLLKGSARLIDTGAEHSAALEALRERYPQYWAMALDDRPVIAIGIERVVAWGALD
jgi:coenzyme F420-0:L-glutamate ligase / coenzyme F420-1:gamma-L-glutamate ligase